MFLKFGLTLTQLFEVDISQIATIPVNTNLLTTTLAGVESGIDSFGIINYILNRN